MGEATAKEQCDLKPPDSVEVRLRRSQPSADERGMKIPRELYSPSPRPYRGLPDLRYPLHDRDALVTACGRICMHRKKISISYVLAGQRVGIKEVDDGIWIVSFMHYDLGYIDLEQKTLQPLDNPFGARLLPMS
jgi:hypothetical protein